MVTCNSIHVVEELKYAALRQVVRIVESDEFELQVVPIQKLMQNRSSRRLAKLRCDRNNARPEVLSIHYFAGTAVNVALDTQGHRREIKASSYDPNEEFLPVEQKVGFGRGVNRENIGLGGACNEVQFGLTFTLITQVALDSLNPACG